MFVFCCNCFQTIVVGVAMVLLLVMAANISLHLSLSDGSPLATGQSYIYTYICMQLCATRRYEQMETMVNTGLDKEEDYEQIGDTVLKGRTLILRQMNACRGMISGASREVASQLEVKPKAKAKPKAKGKGTPEAEE